jgi:hypothetical protein
LCKIKTFVGTSANAVKTQVWTALIAMLVLKYLQLKSSFSWSLSTLAALLRQQLFFYRDLWEWSGPVAGIYPRGSNDAGEVAGYYRDIMTTRMEGLTGFFNRLQVPSS